MSYELSFDRTQFWMALSGALLLLVLMFGVGFVSGAIWQRSRPEIRPVTSAKEVRSIVAGDKPTATERNSER